MTQKILREAFRALDLSKKDRDLYIPAILGFYIGGNQVVEVPNRPGYVYVRIRSNLNEVVQVYNDKVSPVFDLPVLIYRDEMDVSRYRIYSRDVGRYNDWGSSTSYIPRHGNQHSFNPDTGGGGDITFVYGKQFMPLALTPSGSVGAGNVILNGYPYYQNTAWHYAGTTGTPDILTYKPTGSNARVILIYLDSDSNPQVLAGNYLAENITGTSQIISYLPSLPSAYDIPLGAIRLVSGTSKVLWDNIYDLRPFVVGDGFVPTLYAPVDASYITLGLNGTLTNERVLTAGDGISFVDTGANGTLTISVTGSVGGGGAGTILIYDDNSFSVTGTAIVFGENIYVFVTGSVAYVGSSIPTGSGHIIQEGGITQSTRGTLNFIGLDIWDNPGADSLEIYNHPYPQAFPAYNNGIYIASGTSIDFEHGFTVSTTGTMTFIESTKTSDQWNQSSIEDEFVSGKLLPGHIGMGWQSPAGRILVVNSEPSHPGIVQVSSYSGTSVGGPVGSISLSCDSVSPIIPCDDIDYIGFILRAGIASGGWGTVGSLHAGLMETPTSSGTSSQGIYFVCEGGLWSGFSRDGITGSFASWTSTDKQNEWVLLEIKRAKTYPFGLEWWMNNSLVDSGIMNTPTGSLHLAITAQTDVSGTDRNIDVDWVGLMSKKHTSRWT